MTKTLTFGVFILIIILTGSFGPATAQIASAPQVPTAALLSEDFGFSGPLSANGWSIHSGTTFPQATTTGLTFTGHPGSGIGNAVLVGNTGGEDVNKPLSSEQSGDGTVVYYSFLVNVNDAAAAKTGDYFIHIGDRVSENAFTLFAARVYARIVSDKVKFGLSNTSTPEWGATNFAKNTTYLLIVKYAISTAGADSTQLWVIPSGVPATENAAGTPEVSNTTTTGQDIIDAVGLRQGSSVNQPQTVVDAIRVGTTWSDVASGLVRDAPGDFNGDGKTDFSIVRPGPGGGSGTLTWWIRLNGPNTFSGTQWGFNSDFIVPADFDGDGKDDIAIWRSQSGNSGFWIIRSSDNTFSFVHIGQPGDDPLVVADYTGDGIDDPAIYRAGAGNSQSFFWYSPSSGPFVGQFAGLPWGMGGDTGLLGDYNGDGVADFTVARVEGNASVVYTMFGTIDGSIGETRRTIWGLPSDFYVPGDYDGDGKTDLAVTRWVGSSLRWIYLPSSGAPIAFIPWGISNGTDLEAHGDYDGDGITDLAVWRTSGALAGFFIVRLSSGGVLYEHWGGLPGDAPTIWEFK